MPHVIANGHRLWVECVGDGPPLLMIMGLGASHETWAAQREPFARSHRIILFDNRGAGRSDHPPPPWTVADMARDAVGVLDALGVARADVIGVSMGGMIAQEMAIADPARVDRLVVALSFGRPDPIRRAFLLHRRWARSQGADLMQEGLATLPWLVSPALLNDGARLASVLETLAAMPLMDADAYALQIDAILEHETLPRLRTVHAPTLVLAAAEDVLTPVFLSEEIAAAIPDARLMVLPRGNHAVQIEYPEDFNHAVLDWLRMTPSAQTKTPMACTANAPPRR